MNPKTPQYKIIDTGNISESKKARWDKIIDQIPIGKAIVFHNKDQVLKGKTLVEIIDPKDIPPTVRPNKHMPPEIKQTLIKTGFKNVTKTGKKHVKHT